LSLFGGYPTWITLPGEPQAYQRMAPNGRGGLWKRDAAAQEAIGWQLRAQYRGEPFPLSARVALYARFWVARDDKDASNMLKLLEDGARGILWQDDKRIKRVLVAVDVDRERPRTELAFGLAAG
jgi:Holliday junction resolvase RusA-like endonuclease